MWNYFYPSVVEFNESVVPTRLYEVPLGIKCIVQDGEFTYIGCDDGGLYGKSKVLKLNLNFKKKLELWIPFFLDSMSGAFPETK